MKLKLPLSVYISKTKKIYCNLNWYRRAHFRQIHAAEVAYKEMVLAAVVDAGLKPKNLKLTPPVKLCYRLFPKSNRRMDLSNVLSIVEKFTNDALVELKFLEDDNFEIIREVCYSFGYVDPDNPRVELEIDEFRGAPDTQRQGSLFAD